MNEFEQSFYPNWIGEKNHLNQYIYIYIYIYLKYLNQYIKGQFRYAILKNTI
jgi:hypothetical protein